jgi:hypothetical protein
MPELKRQWIAFSRLSDCFSEKSLQWTYSLSTPQVHDYFGFAIVFLEELAYDLLYGVHTKPVTAVDERIAANIFRRERLIVVRFTAEVQLRNTSFGDDATVIRLLLLLVRRRCFAVVVAIDCSHIHNIIVSLFSLGANIVLPLSRSTRRLHLRSR